MLRNKLMSICVLASALVLLLFGAANAAVEKGPYLIYDGVNTEMKVLWQLDSSKSCTIEWGENASYSMGSAVTVEYNSGIYGHQHSYRITGLAPATKYFYQVICTPDNVGNGSFYTAPSDDAGSVKFMVYGDTRSYPGYQDKVNAQMITTYTEDPGFQSCTILTGDFVEFGYIESYWTSEFFDPVYLNSHEFQANMPINGCKGNHEYDGILFEKYFPYPYEPGGFYWSFDYGPAHIVIIDNTHHTYYTAGSEQYKWLVNDLASTDKNWKFLILHKPGWSAGPHSNKTEVQNYLQPLCLTYGVDVVFASHNHNYARGVVDGVQHITTGGGGAPLATPNPDSENILVAVESLHFCEVDIQGNQLDFTAIDADGNIIDSFSISHPVEAPSAITGTATSLTKDSATLNGKVNPNGASTMYHLEFGTTTSYGSTTPSASAGSGTGTVSVNASTSGLSSDTIYHYRTVATNSGGISYGDDETFSTIILYVEPSGSCGGNTSCYTTIQAAIDAASSGSVIKVMAGTYAENLDLNSSNNYELQGGWNSTYTSKTSTSTVSSMTFGSNCGTVTVGDIVVQ